MYDMERMYLIRLKGFPNRFYHIPTSSRDYDSDYAVTVGKSKIACFYKKMDAFRAMLALEKHRERHDKYPDLTVIDLGEYKSDYIGVAKLELYECDTNYMEYLFMSNNVNSTLCNLKSKTKFECMDLPFMEFDMKFYSENLENYID